VRARLMVSSAGNAQVMSCPSSRADGVPGLPSSTAALIGFPIQWASVGPPALLLDLMNGRDQPPNQGFSCCRSTGLSQFLRVLRRVS
jgi:hypothetical protein